MTTIFWLRCLVINVKRENCNCSHRGHGGCRTRMSVTLTFDPKDVMGAFWCRQRGDYFTAGRQAWAHSYHTGKQNLSHGFMDINQLCPLSSPTAHSRVLFHGHTICFPTRPGEIPFPGLVLLHVSLSPPRQLHRLRCEINKCLSLVENRRIKGKSGKTYGGNPQVENSNHLGFFFKIMWWDICGEQQARVTSGMVMSMLTRGNGGHSKCQITHADGTSAQLKLMSLQP